MSVLITGIKMPEDCPVCPLAHWNKLERFTGCEVTKRYFSKEDMETRGRPSFCPLVEIPPHGRLIDADALDKQIYNDIPLKVFGNIARMAEMRNIVCNATTIIEAEDVDDAVK